MSRFAETDHESDQSQFVVMIHGGVLPWARGSEGPVFLLGRERTGKWCSFGGRPEGDETIFQTAVREAWEESMGFLGSRQEIAVNINKYVLECSEMSTVFGLEIPYDERLPALYASTFECTKVMTSKYIVFYNQKTKENVKTRETKTGKIKTYRVPVDTADGFLEKIELKWFTMTEINKLTRDIRKQNLSTIKNLTAKILHYFDSTKSLDSGTEVVSDD